MILEELEIPFNMKNIENNRQNIWCTITQTKVFTFGEIDI